MLNDLGITRGQIARYTLLPQLLPRISKLLRSGFINLPYFMVVILNTVRIIPNNHPYLKASSHGTYSMFQALAVAANNITFDRKNIDKITIFGVILTGIAMVFLQLLLCVLALFNTPAFAYTGAGPGPQTIGDFFNNATPNTDLAFILLDLIFGIPGIFTTTTVTTPFHAGLHALFEFYSFGILLVGVFIIIYLVMAIVMETAESGVPFGQRFNHAWAPIRLVLFFGLLLPTPNGINLAQYLLLNAAKLGSNVATNGWITFDNAVNSAYLGNAEQLIATPVTPDMYSLAAFMAIARTCSWAEGRVNGHDIRPYIVSTAGVAGGTDVTGGMPAFATIAEAVQGGTVFVRFGVQDGELYPGEPGAVFPYCGEVSLVIVDQSQPGSAIMQQAYLEMVSCLWNNAAGSAYQCSTPDFSDHGRDYTSRYSKILPYNPYPNMDPHVSSTIKSQIMITMTQDLNAALENAVQAQVDGGLWTNEPAMQMGWAGAGIWFNKIAEQNGALTSAVLSKPQISKMPYVMEYVKAKKLEQDANTPFEKLFTPSVSSKQLVNFETPQQREVALILNQAFKYWGMEASGSYFVGVPETKKTSLGGNIIINVMNVFLGTRGLFDMCANTDVHPLAQLSGIGKAAIEHSIMSFAVAMGFGLGGGIATIMKELNFGQAFGAISSFFMTFAGIGLIVGFLLYYVLPFLPFIYFFFAVMTWVKGIFEAMVGMPLWALAHLRIDGEGLPGDAAASGYFYILEIFLRPICIILSFLGGIIIFTAMVKVLNNIFYLVISNLTGHFIDPNAASATGCFNPPAVAGAGAGTVAPGQEAYARGTVDQFFYTVVYAIIVYMIGLPCFKLVDTVPDNIMRWLSAGISSFGAQDGDPADNLMGYMAGGAGVAGGGLQQAMGGTSGSLAKEMKKHAAKSEG